MKTPLENIIDWIEKLSLTQKREIILEIGSGISGIDMSDTGPLVSRNFISQLNEHKQNIAKEVELVLCLKARFDDLMASKLKECANWREEKEELDSMAEMTGSCAIAEVAMMKQQQYQKWALLNEKWQTLSRQYLSKKTIGQWHQEHTLDKTRH